jgi:hypothetical protein
MTHKLTLACIALLIFTSNSFSNTALFPGYYINNNGDTVHCKFKFNDWRVNPKAVTAYDGNNILTFSPTAIKGFGVDGFADYKSETVSYHRNNISGLNLPEEYSEVVIKDIVFLKILTTGMYWMYELTLTDPDRSFYFISENNGSAIELVYRVREKEMKYEEDKQYQRTLFDLFSKEGIAYQYTNAINETHYKSHDIRKLINVLNERHTGIKPKKTKSHFFTADIFGGMINNSFPSKVKGRYSDDNAMSSCISPSGGINFTYYVPGHFHALALGISISYNKYTSSGSKTDSVIFNQSVNYNSNMKYHEDYSIKNSMVMTNFYAMYFMNKFHKVRFFVKGGAYLNYAATKDNDLYTHFTSHYVGHRNGIPTEGYEDSWSKVTMNKNFFFNMNAALGISSGRHKVELTYLTPVNFDPFNRFMVNMMGAYYYFTFAKL